MDDTDTPNKGAAMTVKPLEWGSTSDNGTTAATTAYGVGQWALFVVQGFDPARTQWRWSIDLSGDFAEFPDDATYPTIDAAKDAANRWHADEVRQWIVG